MAQRQISANERAWLDTIAYAEGTYFNGDPKGYRTMFGYKGELDTNKGHPDQVISSGGYQSAAAGRYQFMPGTWAGAVKALGLDGRMTPENQDQAALHLIRQRGVDPTQPISRESVAKLAPEWASLPTIKGNSYYGQPVKSYDSLAKVYGGQLSNPGNTTPATPAAPATPATPDSGTGTGTGADAPPQQTFLGGLMANDDGPLASLSPLPQAPASNPMAFAQSLMDPQSDAPPVQISRRRIGGPTSGLAAGGTRMAGSPGPNYFARLEALTQPPVS